jgi:hypothetical protein
VYRSPIGHDVPLLPVGQYSPSELAALVDECRAAGLLVADPTADPPSVFVHWWTAFELHRLLTEQQRGGEITDAHRLSRRVLARRAAEYWRWRISAWPQDHRAQREAGYHPQVSELSREIPSEGRHRATNFLGAIGLHRRNLGLPRQYPGLPGHNLGLPRRYPGLPGRNLGLPGRDPGLPRRANSGKTRGSLVD